MKYEGEYTNWISFPMGGIGTGSIGLDGDGRLIDWEIFNRPSKGSYNGYTHFAIKASSESGSVTRVLNGENCINYMGQYRKENNKGYGFGPDEKMMYGFPHFTQTAFIGKFPIAELLFSDKNFPAKIKMTAFNPLIPNDEDDSSIPAAFFEFEIENTTSQSVTYTLAFSVNNPFAVSKNESSVSGGMKLLKLINAGADMKDTAYGDLSVATDAENCVIQNYWYRGGWQDKIVTFWNDFTMDAPLRERTYDSNGSYDVGTVTASVGTAPGETKKIRFVLSWNVPNNYNYWNPLKDENGQDVLWKNYYAVMFRDSEASALYALSHWDDLYKRTKLFTDTAYGSTLPESVKDAAFANLSVLKSPTVLRLSDGSFYGWEGTNETSGSCEGTCQHVWNYAYALCFLFPRLERSIRESEFRYCTTEEGKMGFRIGLPQGRGVSESRACLDGQMGAVIKCYREWKLSGDDAWLAEHFDTICRVLEYAWSKNNLYQWDGDKSGILSGLQHHTLDMELFGASSWLEGLYLLALKAAEKMAEHLGKTDKAKEYGALFENGKHWMAENLFNGKYFIQKIDIKDKSIVERFNAVGYWNDESGEIKYQIADGSSIDQMLAQWHADIIGLGDIFDEKQMDSALDFMMKYNFKERIGDMTNPWRIFSLNDEAGSVICAYPPDVQKPKIPIPYCEETMTGFEYSFAGLLCSRNKIDSGIRVVSAIRDRFDGKKRNPWNEFECGSNYARSMASYALIPILSGFEFDMPEKHIGFSPRINREHFSSVWSVGGSWGRFEATDASATLTIYGLPLRLKSFRTPFDENVSRVLIDGKPVDFSFESGTVSFHEAEITDTLEIIQ